MEHTEQNVYQTLTGAEKENIQEKAQALTKLLGVWVSCYPFIRAKRVPPVAVLVATVLPLQPLDVSLLVGKLILFIFAVDDLADERLLSYIEFKQAAKVWQDIARFGQTDRQAPEVGCLSAVISEIRRELTRFNLFPNLVDVWADRLGQLCDAMADEYTFGLRYKASQGEILPTIDDYIAGGIHSVGFPFWGTSVLILLSEPAILVNLQKITEIILQTGAAIRLYNDVRTYEKEVSEDNINAITILRDELAAGELALSGEERLQQAQERVLCLAGEYAEKCYALSDHFVTETHQFELMIRRIVAFHANFYGSRKHTFDYHTVSSTDSFSMIQGAV